MRRLEIFVIACVFSLNQSVVADDKAGLDFFERQVRPLLVKRCYECHSAKSEELNGGLALDSKAGWSTGGDSGPALMPGDVDGSLLIGAVRYEDYEMPPDGKLPDHEIAVFEKWVRMGAPDSREGGTKTEKDGIDFSKAREFWAFQAAKRHHPPAVEHEDWPKCDIDHFILAGLEAANLKPAKDADKRTWLRRVTFDLTGLPPTLKQIEEFCTDRSAKAKQRVVDQLLASEEFGRHWGRHWLDVARYADSNGSDFNATYFNAWRYRNYVIKAFNEDKPFDQFIREQLAGDLLPYQTDEQRTEQLIATGFLMVGPKMLSERDKEKLLMDVADEQISTVGRAFMGLTLGCARCHDHKFDPVPTRDYYALAGIFRSTESLFGESQQYVSAWRESPLPMSPELSAAVDAFKKSKSDLQSNINVVKKRMKSAESKMNPTLSYGVVVDDSQAKTVGYWKPSRYNPRYVGEGYIHDDRKDKGDKSVTFTPDLPKSGRYEVRMAYAGGSNRAAAVPVTIRHADGEETIKVNQRPRPKIDGLFAKIGTFTFEKGTIGFVRIRNEGTTGYVMADAIQFIPVEQLNAPPPEKKDAAKLVANLKGKLKTLEDQMKELEKKAPEVPKAMAVREQENVEDCRLCIRGEHKRRGDAVPRGFVQVVSNGETYLRDKQQSGRRELAEWITHPAHSLTSRVIVNRIWHHLLGEGIVRSCDNFGKLGERPTHPELLDTLAVQFVDDGWSVKRQIRRIVLSRTYGMSSRHNPEAAAKDPENRLLWRAHRRRLSAESLRDAMLMIGGKLDLREGKSPVKGLGRLAIDNSKQGTSGRNADLRLRSVFLPIVRNELPEFLTLFDFADPDVVTGNRSATNVPAQALFLLNSATVRELANATAQRLLEESNTEDERLDRLYELAVGRPPTASERQRMTRYLSEVSQDNDDLESWTRVAQVMFASTEFRMLN